MEVLRGSAYGSEVTAVTIVTSDVSHQWDMVMWSSRVGADDKTFVINPKDSQTWLWSISDWCFGTWILWLFHRESSLSQLTIIFFQRGTYTTNQISIQTSQCGDGHIPTDTSCSDPPSYYLGPEHMVVVHDWDYKGGHFLQGFEPHKCWWKHIFGFNFATNPVRIHGWFCFSTLDWIGFSMF